MNREKMIADELQCMFLEGKLNEYKEEYINTITRKLRIGELTIFELVHEDSRMKGKILEAYIRLSVPSINTNFEK